MTENEPIEDIDESDVDDLDAFEPSPAPRKPKAALHHAPALESDTSWWVGKDREAFSAAARENEDRLMRSKWAQKLTVRTLP